MLVGAMARRLRVDLGSLSAADKIQLIGVVVGAWQTFQQQSQHGDSTRCTLAGRRHVLPAGARSRGLSEHPHTGQALALLQVGHDGQRAPKGAHCRGRDGVEAEGSSAHCHSGNHHLLAVRA